MQLQLVLHDGQFQVGQQREMCVRRCFHRVIEAHDVKLLDLRDIERHIGAAHHGGQIKAVIAQLRPADVHAHVNGLLDHMQRQVKLCDQMLERGLKFDL